jgi:hypothetical protein
MDFTSTHITQKAHIFDICQKPCDTDGTKRAKFLMAILHCTQEISIC